MDNFIIHQLQALMADSQADGSMEGSSMDCHALLDLLFGEA